MATITVTVYDDEDGERVLTLPATMQVCWVCQGEGSIPDRALSPTGDGSWTGDEMAEFMDADPDMYYEYFGRTAYQQSCPECDGRNVVPVVDETRCNPLDLKLYVEHQLAEAEYARERASELRWGY